MQYFWVTRGLKTNNQHIKDTSPVYIICLYHIFDFISKAVSFQLLIFHTCLFSGDKIIHQSAKLCESMCPSQIPGNQSTSQPFFRFIVRIEDKLGFGKLFQICAFVRLHWKMSIFLQYIVYAVHFLFFSTIYMQSIPLIDSDTKLHLASKSKAGFLTSTSPDAPMM